MKADYVITSPGFGQGSIPLEAQRQLSALPNVRVGVGHPQRSGEDRGLGRAGDRGRPHQDRLAVRPAADAGQDLASSTPNGIAVLDTIASDNNWKVGQQVPIEFAQTGKQEFTVESIYKQTGFTSYVITTDAYERNFRDQFDFQVYVNDEGRRHPGEHRGDQEGDAPVPGAQGADPRRVQGVAGRADQPVPEPGLCAPLLRHRDRALRHRQHPRALDHRTPSRARAVARGRHDAAASCGPACGGSR